MPQISLRSIIVGIFEDRGRPDNKLKAALNDWRNKQLPNLGVGRDAKIRLQPIITNEVLVQIVDLAHFSQIDDLVALQGQVS